MDLSGYRVEIRRHAFLRALERGVTPDMIEAAIRGWEVRRFGKSNVKFIKRYRDFDVICVDEISGRRIKIVTIERRE